MTNTVGTAQLEIGANVSGVEAGVSKAKKSISTLGDAAKAAGKEASAGFDNVGKVSASTARAIDNQVKRLQLSAATLGKTATDAKLFELAQRGASKAQLDAAAAALKSVDAYNAQKAAIENAASAHVRLTDGIKKYGAQLGTVAVVAATAIAAIVKRQVDALDAFNDLADATGASIENISALDRVARTTGATFDTVSSVLVKFNSVLTKTDEDSTAAAKVLKSIGLNAEELKKIDPAEALRQTAVALSQFADDGNKARAVQILFGKSVAEAAPFLKDLSEQSKLVAASSEKASIDAEKLNKTLARMEADATDAARALAASLAPAVSNAAQQFLVGMQNADGFLDTVARFRSINPFRDLGDNIDILEGRMKEMRSLIEGNQRLGLPDFVSAPAKANLENAEKQLRFLKALQRQAQVSSNEALNSQFGRDDAKLSSLAARKVKRTVQLPADTPTISKAKSAAAKVSDAPFTGTTYDEKLTQNVGKLLEDSDIIKAQEYADTLVRLNEIYSSGGMSTELYQSALERLNESAGKASDKTVKLTEDQKRLAELLGATVSAEIERQRQDMLLLTDALEKGTIAEEQYMEAIQARLNLKVDAPRLEKTNDMVKELGLSFTSAFEDAIVGGESLSKVLGGLEKDIMRIITRKLVTEPLGNAITGAIGKFFSFDGGGYTGDGPRTGGLDGKGGYMALLHPRETVFDHTKGQQAPSGGQSVVVTNNFTVSGPVTRDTQLQIAAAAHKGLQRGMRNL